MKKNSLLQSFRFAFQGIGFLWLERNFRIHCVAAIIVILAAYFLQVSAIEWCMLLLCCAVVLILEGVNTAIELTCNEITTDFHPLIGRIKDIAAASVLIAAGFSAVIGLIIFLPKIWMIWNP